MFTRLSLLKSEFRVVFLPYSESNIWRSSIFILLSLLASPGLDGAGVGSGLVLSKFILSRMAPSSLRWILSVCSPAVSV